MGLRRRILEKVRAEVRRAGRRAGIVGGSRPLPPARRWSAGERHRLLEHLLLRNVLPFWERRARDGRRGYELHHDRSGAWKGPGPRRFVTQARTVWFWSALSRTPYGRPQHLEWAARGFDFLRERMWDRRHGGFFWELDAANAPVRSDKHVYAQAFAVYALTEHALAAADERAAALADETFDLLERRARDETFGGYREWFDHDWGALPAGRRNDFEVGPEARLLDTTLHLLEAFTAYRLLRPGDVRVRDRLRELVALAGKWMTPDRGAGDTFSRDWRPLPQRGLSYGHHAELAWILLGACAAAGLPEEDGRALSQSFFRSALRGFDEGEGGFHAFGSADGRVRDRTKVWWVQAEALVAALRLHVLTGDPELARCFDRTLAWVLARQADWHGGEWHARVLADGRVQGDKAGVWKCPYHQGRALLLCLEALEPAAGSARPAA